MSIWFRDNKYRVGLSDPPIDVKEQASVFSKITEVASKAAGIAIPMFATMGAGNTGAVLQVLAPFTEAAELFAFAVKLGAPYIVAVIYADSLTTAELTARIERLLELAKPLARLGLGLNGTPSGPGTLVPLCVYFNPQKHAIAVSALSATSRRLVGGLFDPKKVLLQTGYVDVTGQTVIWPGVKSSGFAGAVNGVLKSIGVKGNVFDDADLKTVLFASKLLP